MSRWQSRPLDPLYALVFFDALRVKMRDEGTVRNKAVYLAIGVTPDAAKTSLGFGLSRRRAKFLLRVMTEIKNRGANDILIGSSMAEGFSGSDHAVFPRRNPDLAIVAFDPHSLDFCSWKDRKPGGPGTSRPSTRRGRGSCGGGAGRIFEEVPSARDSRPLRPCGAELGVRHSFFAYPQEVRKMIYTTNAIESLNAKLRRSVRIRGPFSQRRGGDEINLAAIARDHEKLEDATTRMERRQSAVRGRVRRSVRVNR